MRVGVASDDSIAAVGVPVVVPIVAGCTWIAFSVMLTVTSIGSAGHGAELLVAPIEGGRLALAYDIDEIAARTGEQFLEGLRGDAIPPLHALISAGTTLALGVLLQIIVDGHQYLRRQALLDAAARTRSAPPAW